MPVHRVTKAAVLPVSAVIISVVLALIVTESAPVASFPQKSPITLNLQPLIVAAPKQAAPLLAARNSDTPHVKADVTGNLLPVVRQKNIREDHQHIADTVLRRLPSGCRDHLKNFYVLYNNPKQRGLGGKSTIILDGTASDTEFAALLVHECSHVIHANMPGSSKSDMSAFKDGKDTFAADSPVVSFFSISWIQSNIMKQGQTKEDFVSGYAQSDAFEDFAETFAAYVLQRPSLIERARTSTAMAAKLAWMETNLPLVDHLLGIPQYTWDNVVPWDTTKLAYLWNPLSSDSL